MHCRPGFRFVLPGSGAAGGQASDTTRTSDLDNSAVLIGRSR